jgi:hypothetical protein
VEVVSATEKVKDGRTVRQMLIDTYAENEKKKPEEEEEEDDDAKYIKNDQDEDKSLEDVKHGDKFVTPFWQQTWVLGKRTFKQRRHDILSWEKIILITLISILSGLLWLQMDKDGTHCRSVYEDEAACQLARYLLRTNASIIHHRGIVGR